VLAQAPKVAAQWERSVVFRLGRYTGLRGPGLFWIVPFIETLPATIDLRTNPWGVTVQSVDMRDIVIPASLQDAMSREAQATREKQARVILSQAEVEIARSFETASASYQNNLVALQLRAMNMLYEGLKERGGLMVVPSSAVESLGMGGLMGAAAMGRAQLATPEVPPSSANSRA